VFSWLILNGVSFLPTFAITLILGCVLGLLNGYLVMVLRITPVIATLVTLSLYKGIALLIVPDGLSAIKGSAAVPMPGWINDYARKDILLGLPAAFWFAVFIIIVLVIIQRKTILGKYAAAIGGNRLAAGSPDQSGQDCGCFMSWWVSSLRSLAWPAQATCRWETLSRATEWNSPASLPYYWEVPRFPEAKVRWRRRWSEPSSSYA
jgi:ABC-type xylose transport system permease subunit